SNDITQTDAATVTTTAVHKCDDSEADACAANTQADPTELATILEACPPVPSDADTQTSATQSSMSSRTSPLHILSAAPSQAPAVLPPFSPVRTSSIAERGKRSSLPPLPRACEGVVVGSAHAPTAVSSLSRLSLDAARVSETPVTAQDYVDS